MKGLGVDLEKTTTATFRRYSQRWHTQPSLHPTPDFEPEYFSAHLTNDPAREPVAVGSSIPRTIADAAKKDRSRP